MRNIKGNKERQIVMKMYFLNKSAITIAHERNLNLASVKACIAEFQFKNPTICFPQWISALGNKDESYYESEQQMLEPLVYTYDSLSNSEKKIYDKPRINKQNLF